MLRMVSMSYSEWEAVLYGNTLVCNDVWSPQSARVVYNAHAQGAPYD
jgi:uncharacterized heparinase superfamily protein